MNVVPLTGWLQILRAYTYIGVKSVSSSRYNFEKKIQNYFQNFGKNIYNLKSNVTKHTFCRQKSVLVRKGIGDFPKMCAKFEK